MGTANRRTDESIRLLEINKINLYYTTDLRQNEKSLDKGLITFKLDEATNKYKIENVEIKLLG